MRRAASAAALAGAALLAAPPGPAVAAPAGACFDAMPVDGTPSSPFGPRGGRAHRGLDLRAPAGSPVRAAREGRVAVAGAMRGYGLRVDLVHADGTRTRYAHLAGFAPGVAPGRAVAAGERLGTLGRTGRTTGANLHFALLGAGGAPVDPAPRLPGACAFRTAAR